ncbi:MAG: ABC transporter permease [Bacteroidota bacterium]
MLRHNLLIAIRNFKRYKTASLINLLSLSAGLCCALLIYLWVQQEKRVDQFHINSDRLYQILQNTAGPEGIETEPYTPGPLAEALSATFPEVEKSVAVLPYEWFEGEKLLITDGGQRLFNSRNQFASPDFFRLFSFPLLQGDPERVLQDKLAVAISDELALRLFNSTDVVGRRIQWIHDSFGGNYRISGVFAAPPQNSTLQFDAVFNYQRFLEIEEGLQGWNNADPYTFVLLNSPSALPAFNAKLKGFLKTKQEQTDDSLFAQNFAQRYLNDRYENGREAGGRIAYVRLFSLIALFILLIACVNFINMATAQASTRMKEVGVKKTMGAQRSNLILQYLTESVLLAFLSLFIAFALAPFILPAFNAITGQTLALNYTLPMLLTASGIALFAGLFSGLYPAFYLSAFRPVKALRGELSKSWAGRLSREGLVIFQFAISAALIISVIIIYQQISLIQSKNLGYSKEQVIWFPMGKRQASKGGQLEVQELSATDIDGFLLQLKALPGVVDASNFAHSMVGDYGTTTGLTWPGADPERTIQFANIAVGYDFIETMGIEMLAGRGYSRDFSTDHQKIILNEKAVEKMGFRDPIGQTVELWGTKREVVGVAKNFHVEAFYEEIAPLFINLTTGNFASNVMLKIQAGSEAATVDRVREAYQAYFIEGSPFEYQFLDEDYQQLYAQEIRVGLLSRYFAGIALFISCLGLFGFATFTIQRRLKEIAIRKTLGSGVFNIIQLLLKSFLLLVALALLIALPISYLLADHWLARFAYRIELEWIYFAVAALLVLLLSLLTVGLQTLRAARVNTIKYLQQN